MVVLGTAAAAGSAFAQTPCPDTNPPIGNSNCATNPGFEQVNIFNPNLTPMGWDTVGNPSFSRRREVGDGRSPTLFPVGTPNALTPASGIGCIELTTSGFGGFGGFTTDTVNNSLPTFPYFDPIYNYNGGDITITIKYMIPANSPLVGDYGFPKINVKQGNQDVATFENFTDTAAVGIRPRIVERGMPAGITGTTNGQWQTFTLHIPKALINRQYECNAGIRPSCGCVCVPIGPQFSPNHVKITPGRFTGDGSPTSGTIYFDDVTYTEGPAYPLCVADLDDGSGGGHPDGGVGIEDLLYYLLLYDAGDIWADVDDGNGNGVLDGGVGIEDLLLYLTRYDQGC